MQKTICVIGGDARQQAAARALRRAGYSVLPPSGAGRAGCLLLPLPLDRLTPELSRAFAAARPGTLALGGRFGAEVQAAARQAGLETADYFCRPELAALNAVPTAEGCLCLLMQLRDRTLWQSPVLVLGYGRIGRAVGAVAAALGMEVIATGPHPWPQASAPADWVPLEELLRRSDVVSLHCPLTPETRGLIDRSALEQMKEGAFLINNSRGALLVEQDVADALNSGRLAGAGVDVAETEPLSPDSPLLTAKNCIITPHISWAPRETRQRLMTIAVENLRAFLAGGASNVVNGWEAPAE